jgi:hypothetical protein
MAVDPPQRPKAERFSPTQPRHEAGSIFSDQNHAYVPARRMIGIRV